jgi:hypothetical protein
MYLVSCSFLLFLSSTNSKAVLPRLYTLMYFSVDPYTQEVIIRIGDGCLVRILVFLEYTTNSTFNHHLPAECEELARNQQDIKKFVRLVGWVLWSPEKLYD